MDKGYESEELCRACGGACCKANGCSLAPEDMLRELALRRVEEERDEPNGAEQASAEQDGAEQASAEQNGAEQNSAIRQERLPDSVELESWLRDSRCAIDSFTGQAGQCYYIRMRHKCFTFIGVDAMGECVALTENGCSLPYARRPRGGRYLEGRQDRRCLQHYTREQMEEDWEPYQPLLKEIWDRWHDRLENEGVFERCEEEYMRWQREKRQTAGGEWR